MRKLQRGDRVMFFGPHWGWVKGVVVIANDADGIYVADVDTYGRVLVPTSYELLH